MINEEIPWTLCGLDIRIIVRFFYTYITNNSCQARIFTRSNYWAVIAAIELELLLSLDKLSESIVFRAWYIPKHKSLVYKTIDNKIDNKQRTGGRQTELDWHDSFTWSRKYILLLMGCDTFCLTSYVYFYKTIIPLIPIINGDTKKKFHTVTKRKLSFLFHIKR